MEGENWDCGMKHGGMCGSGCQTIDGAIHCHKNRLLKKCFMLMGLLFMFWFGMQLGELRILSRMQESREYGNYGYRMMDARINQGTWNQNQPGTVELRATNTPEKTTSTTK